MTIRPFFHFPPPGSFSNFGQVTAYVRRLWDSLHALRLGKMEVVQELTLTANAATTTFNRLGVSPQTGIMFDAKSANAAAELAAGTMYVLAANRSNDSFIITHANNAQVDRIFHVITVG
jgi:hypothetical protein